MSSADKLDLTLVQRDCARALEAIAEALAKGNEKPGREPGDWCQLTRQDFLKAMYRHLSAEMQGQFTDPDDGIAEDVKVAVNAVLRVEMRLRGLE